MNTSRKNRKICLVVVGSIGIDAIKTPADQKANLLGGSASYACASASFFTNVGMVGVVGTDFPPAFEELYEKFNIDLSGLQKAEGRTFRWSGVYDADMINRRTIFTELNVFEKFSPELPEEYCSSPLILLGNISPELQLRVLSQAKAPKFVIADTMDLWINTSRKKLMELISKVNMLTLNDSEARLLTGEYNLRKCAEVIRKWGPEYIVIKKGEHGAMLMTGRGVFIIPAYPVDEVKDPTGAGDSFAGGFMGALAVERVINDNAIKRSLLAGSVVASFGVEDFSLNRMNAISRLDINARLNELKNMIDFN